MFRDLLIGQYYAIPSPVHRLDPRSKILISVLLIVTLFLVGGFRGYLAGAALIAVVALLGRVPLRLLLRGLRPILFLLVLTVVLHAFMSGRDSEVLAALGPLRITEEGLLLGLRMGIRLALLILISSLLTLTTSPIELTDGLERLLRPANRLGVPVHDLAMMMTIALRFIPTLMDEADRIIKAQTARGADFQQGGLLQRVRALVPVLVPLFISAFRRADDLALAMEARGYRGGEGRTRFKRLRLAPRDALAGVAAAGAAALMIWLGR